MSWISSVLTSSIGRKFVMSLTGLFLVIFLLVHFAVNAMLFLGEESFNEAAHFMATNPLIQFMQIFLAAGFLIHIIQGIMITLQNKAARPVGYAKNNQAAHTPFNARTMIYSGVVILLFLIIHINDFFVPLKFGHVDNDYLMVKEKLSNPIYLVIYIVAFLFLALHLSHGVKSAFQSVGMNHGKYNGLIKGFATIYFWVISLGFIAIALCMFFC